MFFFKQKTAYEMRISDWSSDVCSSDLVAHVNVLFLDIQDRAGLSVLVDFKHDKAKRHAHRRCISNAPLAAFFRIVFWLFQFVLDEIHFSGTREIADRKNATQGLFKAGDIADGWI